jgi:hypothetical protein
MRRSIIVTGREVGVLNEEVNEALVQMGEFLAMLRDRTPAFLVQASEFVLQVVADLKAVRPHGQRVDVGVGLHEVRVNACFCAKDAP